MALSATYYGPADWFPTSGSTRDVTGVAWAAGDIIVVVGGTEDNTRTLSAPTNANLTFTQAVTPGNISNECKAYLYSAKAASAQTGQTISATPSASSDVSGIAVWVISGAPVRVSGAITNYTESGPSLEVGAGDVVISALFDWNATTPGKTPATGSGTATERVDTGNGTNYGIWAADWVGTSAGTFTFGPNNYTGLQVNQVAIVVQATAWDNFTRSDTGSLGADWTNTGATTIGVKTNRAYFGDDYGAGEQHRVRHTAGDLGTADHYAEATIHTLPSGGYGDARIMVRFTSATSAYELRRDNAGSWYLNRITSGGETDIASGSAGSFSSGEVWRLEATGTNPVALKVYKNGVQQGSTTNDSDATRIQTGNIAGLGGYTAGGSPSDVAIDNWSAGAVSAGGPTAHDGAGSGAWGGWTATGAGDVGHQAAGTGVWGGWTATGAGDVGHQAAGTGVWGGWTATAAGRVGNQGAGAGAWGTWVATGVGTTAGAGSGVGTGAWGGWTATGVGRVGNQAAGAGSWGGWTATAAGRVGNQGAGAGAWGTWVATGAGDVGHRGASSTTWGGWTATGAGRVGNQGAGTGAWGTWVATGVGEVTGGGTGAGSGAWGGWTATGAGRVGNQAAGAGSWGGWAGSGAGRVGNQGAGAGAWGTWVATGIGLAETPGAGSGVGTGAWGGWTATGAGDVGHYGAGTGVWGGWTASVTITPVVTFERGVRARIVGTSGVRARIVGTSGVRASFP